MSEELKPCPFCGGEAEYFDHSEHHESAWHEVSCSNPACTYLIAKHPKKESAVSAWNTRYISEGYALVPIDPSDKMIQAGIRADGDSFPLLHIYKAMIAAALEGK